MDVFRSFIEILIQWKFWLLCFFILVIVYFLAPVLKKKEKIPGYFHIFLIFIVSLIINIPNFIAGFRSLLGVFNAPYFMIQTQMITKMAPESHVWNRILAGGRDYLFLPGATFSFAKLYPSFLNIGQEFMWIVFINTAVMFLVTWMIQIKIFHVSRPLAFLGGLLCAVTQGFVTGLDNLHSLQSLPLILFVLHTCFESKKAYVYALLMGVLFSLCTAFPIHNFPSGFLVVSLWLCCFYPHRLFRCILLIVLFTLPLLILNFEYIVTAANLSLESARGNQVVTSVGFLPFGVKDNLAIFGVGLSLLYGVRALKLYEDKQVLRMIVFLLLFSLAPSVGYVLQELKIFSSYRWALLYLEVWFPYILGFIVIVDRIFSKLYQRSSVMGLWGWGCSSLALILLCLNQYLFHAGFSLGSFYEYGDWGYVANNAEVLRLKGLEREPFRVLNYGGDLDIVHMGHYDGVETIGGGGGGYLLDKDWIEFWNILGGHIIQDDNVIYVEDQGGEEASHLSSINVELLKLMNVRYLFSKRPVVNEHFELISFTPAVGEYHPCDAPRRTHLLRDLEKFFRDLQCVFYHERFTPPLYVYKMQDPFPRIYLASAVEILPAISKKDLMDAVFDKKAVLRKASEIDTLTNQNFSAQGNVEIKEYKQDSIEFEVKTNSRQFVILSDGNNRFWKLFINGKPAQFYNVNITQTGFFVGQGESIVQFAYCPPRLRIKLGLVPSSCLADMGRHGAVGKTLDQKIQSLYITFDIRHRSC